MALPLPCEPAVERITDWTPEQTTLAIIVRHWKARSDIQFLTRPEDQLQLGCMKWPAGHRVFPHVHACLPRTVSRTTEVLFVRSGSIRLNIHSVEHDDTLCHTIASRELRAGDVALLLSGGHSIEVLEEAELWEVKQGPYVGSEDKRRLSIVP